MDESSNGRDESNSESSADSERLQGKSVEPIFDQIDKILKKKFQVNTIFVGGNKFEIISMDEFPTDDLIELSKIEGREQILRMKSMAQICLVNPKDQEKLDSLSFSQFGRFVKLWLISSNTSDSIFKEDDLDDN